MDKNQNNGGLGFPEALTLLFIGLKLTNNINWNWLWVLSPVWMLLAVELIVAVIAGIISK